MEETFISTGPALEEGIFVERPNRFLIRCALKKAGDGAKCAPPRSLVEAHLPDPGRLKELLVPGRRIWLRSVNNKPRRKTKWTAVLTERPDGEGLVSLDSTLPNRLIARALQEGVLEEFQGWSLLSAEFKMVHSRWDFLLAGPAESRLVLEVKSVTLVENGVGLFPDAITARGTRHLQELAEIARQPDWKAAALFVLQRDDACRIEAARSIDQTFAAALEEARAAGVSVFGRRCIVTLEKVILGERVPVVTPAEKNSLLKKYWSIPERQVETSVMLAEEKWFRIKRKERIFSRDTREKLANSLTAKTTELIPFLPYLLQDLWELGSIPADIEALIREHVKSPGLMSVLDLACGKGAVSVHLAKIFGCRIKGIDFFPEFIESARRKAGEFSVSELCEFQVGDINEAVLSERGYDMVIFGSVGDVLGNYGRTLNMLRRTVKDGGYIIIDDAYSREEKDGEYLSFKGWMELFRKGKVDLLAFKTTDELELAEMNAVQQASIRRRAEELKLKYPEKSHLFDGYVASQQAECDELEEDIMGVTWLLKKQKTENE